MKVDQPLLGLNRLIIDNQNIKARNEQWVMNLWLQIYTEQFK